MTKRIYVDNLPETATSESLTALFSGAGVVESASVVISKSEQHAFLEMGSAECSKEAIRRFNGSLLEGKRLTVTHAAEPARKSLGFSGTLTTSERRRRRWG